MNIKITVTGLVQGIGYRPFILRIANEFGISGSVKNINGVVEIYACGSENAVAGFLDVVKSQVPEGGRLDSVMVENLENEKKSAKRGSEPIVSEDNKSLDSSDGQAEIVGENSKDSFTIIESATSMDKIWPVLPADLATCEDCERELFDVENRRFKHPFISCVKCGPRYTVTEKLPYDRKRLVLKKFDLCPKCENEYTNAADRRCFAQTISCKVCGPKLNRPIEEAISDIKAGKILAVKDVGGFHLACLIREDVIARLRALKRRPTKPFAVMFESVSEVEKYAFVNDKERELLLSPARPIVLLKLRDINGALDGSTSPYLGAMFPCNPVQMMLIKECGPLIMTSANTSGGLMITDNEMMQQWLEERANRISENDVSSAENVADIREYVSVLSHDRDILVPLDDSIVRVVRNHVLMVRRARGYAPLPINININGQNFAAGGDLKATFAFSVPGSVYMGPTLSDLEDERCASVYENEVARMKELFGFEPEGVAVDKHPLYKSVELAKDFFSKETKDAKLKCDKLKADKLKTDILKAEEAEDTKSGWRQLSLTRLQHHKAHVASVIAEHSLKGDVLGFAFDGTGFGDDGTIWGSEVFKVSDALSNSEVTLSFERIAHLPELSLMASDEASKNCKAAAMALDVCVNMIDEEASKEQSEYVCDATWFGRLVRYIKKQCADNKTQIYTADEYALTEAAIKNNINRVKSTSAGRYFDAVSSMLGLCQYNTYEGEAAQELEYAAVKGDERAIAFHRLIADFIIKTAEEQKIEQVALSGGTFLNRVLLEMVIDGLEEKGFKVYINEQVSCGDGGLALGQLYLMES